MIYIPDYGTTIGADLYVPRQCFTLKEEGEEDIVDTGTLQSSKGLYWVDPYTCTELEFLDWLENASLDQLEKFSKGPGKTGFYQTYFYLKHDNTIGQGDRFIEDA